MSSVRTIYSGLLSLSFGIKGCLSDDICENTNSVLYCSSGCCGSYRDYHCCSHTGLIIGIVVCVAVITAVVVIYCYLRHRNRKRTHAQTLICVPNARSIAIVNSMERPRGPVAIAGPAMPGYPPPYDYTLNQPPLQPKGPPPTYDSVYRTAAGIGGGSSNNVYPPPVS